MADVKDETKEETAPIETIDPAVVQGAWLNQGQLNLLYMMYGISPWSFCKVEPHKLAQQFDAMEQQMPAAENGGLKAN